MVRSACKAFGLGVEKVPRGTTESLHSCGRVMPPLCTNVASFSERLVLEGTFLVVVARLVIVIVVVEEV